MKGITKCLHNPAENQTLSPTQDCSGTTVIAECTVVAAQVITLEKTERPDGEEGKPEVKSDKRALPLSISC